MTELKEIKPDALIISDPGVFDDRKAQFSRRWRSISAPRQIIQTMGHILFWYEQGAKRVVTARELSLKEIRGDPGAYSGGYGDRELHPRSDVHFLFRKMSSQQFL